MLGYHITFQVLKMEKSGLLVKVELWTLQQQYQLFQIHFPMRTAMALSVMELCFKQYLLIKKALLIFSVLKYQYALEKINQYSLETFFNKIIN